MTAEEIRRDFIEPNMRDVIGKKVERPRNHDDLHRRTA